MVFLRSDVFFISFILVEPGLGGGGDKEGRRRRKAGLNLCRCGLGGVLSGPCQLQMLPRSPALSGRAGFCWGRAEPLLTCLVLWPGFCTVCVQPQLGSPRWKGPAGWMLWEVGGELLLSSEPLQTEFCPSYWELKSQWRPAGSVLKGQWHVHCDGLGLGCIHSFFLFIIALLQYSSTHTSPSLEDLVAPMYSQSCHRHSQFWDSFSAQKPCACYSTPVLLSQLLPATVFLDLPICGIITHHGTSFSECIPRAIPVCEWHAHIEPYLYGQMVWANLRSYPFIGC